MAQNTNNNNILSVLENFTLDNSDDIAREVAENFRKRRVEKKHYTATHFRAVGSAFVYRRPI